MENFLQQLPGALLPWYDQNKRELPWRQDKVPYHIWLSEIMLQQTRVEAVKGYYARFLEALPTVADLAACDDDRLHKLWEGLGYYSRVRNLKKAAIEIMERHGGAFPRDHADVLALPGIGEYTAGAICSICFDLPTPAVDGNVLRVYSRLTADTTPIDSPAFKRSVQQTLAGLYPERAGDFTQALMELGATICGPNRAPDCEKCPCRSFCLGYRRGVAANLPVKGAKKDRRVEEKTVFVLSCDGHYALRKRPADGLLASLWEFPNVPGTLELPAAIDTLAQMGLQVREVFRQLDKKHIFTHVQWQMRCFYLEVAAENEAFAWRTAAEIDADSALPTAFRQFWENGI
ncbi:MAG: A/G-specific adenine glycosylase [Oscillospiraceae bacterium]|nr:A/G-specific adenine glycosylase [Oscillospiraceae bacterium]